LKKRAGHIHQDDPHEVRNVFRGPVRTSAAVDQSARTRRRMQEEFGDRM